MVSCQLRQQLIRPALTVLLGSLIGILYALPHYAVAQSMKQLSATTGWYERGDHLYWTDSAGEVWSELRFAPPASNGASISVDSVHFKDPREGWVVVSYEPRETPLARKTGNVAEVYVLCHTSDGGSNWEYLSIRWPALPKDLADNLDGISSVFFLNSKHGWLDVAFVGNYRMGQLLETDDGGASWKWAGGPPHSGDLSFSSENDGWLISNWGSDQLYATHDGGHSWNEVHLANPSTDDPAKTPAYPQLPIFPDPMHGYIAVNFISATGTAPALVFFQTSDAGRTWIATKKIIEPQEAAYGTGIPFAIADTSAILATTANNERSSKRENLTDKTTSSSQRADMSVERMSFANAQDGWRLERNGALYQTSDGGDTWADITPVTHQRY